MKSQPLWKSSSSFESAIYRFKLLAWLKRALKARNAGYGSWLWKKGISKAQKVFKGFKDLGSTIHQLFFIVVFVEETTYNLVNLKVQTFLNISYNANPPFLDE